MRSMTSGKIKPEISHKSGGPVAQRLELLIEMFRMDEKVLVYAEKFAAYLEKISYIG